VTDRPQPIFSLQKLVLLQHTDATQVIFFPAQLEWAVETFEKFLLSRGTGTNHLMTSPYRLPVVHVESEYLNPIALGEEVTIHLHPLRLGRSSVSSQYTVVNNSSQEIVGSVKLVFVCLDKAAQKSTPLPEWLRELLT
jgi:acyl-CoA thioester hydrolase